MYNNNDFVYVENSSKKLLYVTVFVAALFVAVLSGTFAYFTASATNTDAITGTIADVGMTLTVQKMVSVDGTATNGSTLIPFNLIDSSGTLTTTALTDSTDGAIPNGCIDDNAYTACDIFKITISANNTVNVNGYLKLGPSSEDTDVDYLPNVKWMLLGARSTTSAANIENITSSVYSTSYMSASKAIATLSYNDYNDSSNFGNEFTGGGASTSATKNDNYDVVGTSNSYYYIMVWLEDTEDVQMDMGSYVGTVTFTGEGTTEGRITASFGS